MDYHYQATYALEEGLALLPGLLSMIPSGAIQIAAYVLSALALYTMAKRRGINHPWLSWVPVLNVWILGSLSDQYRYVVKGQYKSKRKALIILNIISMVLVTIIACLGIVIAVEVVDDLMFGMADYEIWEEILGPVLGIVGLALPLLGVNIAAAVIRYMALYDVYTACDPQYSVLFLLLSIFFSITEPFFLFFSRNKDAGMPPRRQEPQYAEPQYNVPQYAEPQYEVPQQMENTENE